ncbi:FadR/GntR family transcriptional regulator [Acidovorax cavernicola]|uniref:FadR family transcriptional regulator n=1 Tax=Acidovorax cavernicola TaxID=1675792 RepID=A0A9X8D1I5_9BURK|nr:FadR/GntR family transcriptional regulator [Acidovorax cavernicola]RIX76262.1 FadR family transcriptional regulator [Acidovorax cavernicola]
MLASPAVAATAARLIQQRIADGTYAAGGLLPSQRDLAEQLGISRTSLREALSTLQGTGLVIPRPGKGMYVAEDGAQAPASPAWKFATSHSLQDVYQLRFAVENFTARLACLVIEPEDLEALRANAQAMRACIDAADFAQATQLDFDFHMQIIGIAGNQAIAEILRNSAEVMQESQRLPFYKRGARHATYDEHMAIIEALAKGDPALAQQAMTQHIVQAAQRAGVHFPTGLEAAPSAP